MPYTTETLDKIEKRFRNSVNKDGPIHPILGTPCWEWTASKCCGYGQFRALGEYGAHRVMYRWLIGGIPEGLYVLHKCDNPGCVNPEHLEIGTHQDNMDDRSERGRTAVGDRNGSRTKPECLNPARGDQHGSKSYPERFVGPMHPASGSRNGAYTKPECVNKGEEHGMAVLTDKDVQEIRQKYKKRSRVFGAPGLAKQYGVSSSTIYDILYNRNWRHLLCE